MVLFPKEKVPYPTWYFFPLVLFPSIRTLLCLLRNGLTLGYLLFLSLEGGGAGNGRLLIFSSSVNLA